MKKKSILIYKVELQAFSSMNVLTYELLGVKYDPDDKFFNYDEEEEE